MIDTKDTVTPTEPNPEDTNPDRPASESGRASSCPDDKDYTDSVTLHETVEAAKDAFEQKKAEFFALTDVVGAETNLVKKSLIVTVLSTLAAFVFGCFCWMVINWALALGLHSAGLHFALVAGVIFIINLLMAGFAFKIAKDAYRHLTLMPVFHAFCGHAGIQRQEENS